MLDAVIVTADSRDMVLQCLDHLTDPSVRAIVVDNGSTDGTAEAVAARPDATLVRLDAPTGLARAFNSGAAAGRSELVLFLNDDIFATDGSVAALAGALRVRPDAVAAGGRLVDPVSGATQARYLPARFPSFATFAVMLSGLASVWPDNPWTRPDRTLEAREQGALDVDQPAGACLLVRRDALERIGGWDERFFFWYEDVDICRRLTRLGAIVWMPEAAFRHVGGASFARWDRARATRSMLHGLTQYGAAHLARGRQAALGALVLAVAAPRVVAFACLRPDLAAVYRDALAAGTALVRGRPVPPLVTPV